MRGEIDPQVGLLTLTTPEKRVPADHPIREIKRLADSALKELDPVFDAMYAHMGRPSTPPERLLKAQLLIAFYSIRSERQFCERLDYDLLFRFFLDMSLDEATWDPSTFAKNRDRLVEHEVSKKFFEEIVRAAKAARLLSAEHFTVDGTLIEAWASLKSFRRKGEKPGDRRPPDDKGNPSVDFRGEKRSNATHESRQIRSRSSRRRAISRRRSCRTRGTSSWRIEMAFASTSAARRRAATPRETKRWR